MDSPKPRRIQNALLQMPSEEFERFVAEVWDQMGWETNVTRQSNDRGIDVLATRSGIHKEKAAIQAKRYSPPNKVGRPEIQQYDSIRRQDSEVDFVIVVTTSGFTGRAQQLADELNVKLIGGDDLASAALEYLPSERISNLFPDQRETSDSADDPTSEPSAASKSGPDLPYEDISRDELSDVECELADIYQSHWEKRTDEYGGTPASSLVFKFKKNPEVLEIYQVLVGLHSIEFTSTKRRGQAAKTAEKYNWPIDNQTTSISSVGDSLSGSLTESLGTTLLNIRPNGEIGETFNPEFEARFTKIVLEEFLDSSFDEVSHLEETPFDSDGNFQKYVIDT